MKATEKPKGVDCAQEQNADFKAWHDLFGILAWKFLPTKTGDMMIDAEEVYNELKDKFELKIK